MDSILNISTIVRAALSRNEPIVALESTIITHGMPYPQNLETALSVEAIIRNAGAIPATIAVLHGKLKIGLNDAELNALATARSVMKLSRADLAIAVSRKATGSTTVAATMIAAQFAGLNVFATGGIGGVHRGAEHSFDISADLSELARTPVNVVCAGAKAILDIPKTLEVLETLGVPVLAYGQENIPAFWSQDSGITAPLSVNSIAELVAFIRARESLSISGGVLIANPVPVKYEIPRIEMEVFITQAIDEANSAGVTGKEVTPWILTRIVELTKGRSLETNKYLITNNARLAAELSVALAT